MGSSEGSPGVRLVAQPEGAFRQPLDEAVAPGIAIVGPDGRQVYVNSVFCRMVGWSEEELIGAAAPFVYWPEEDRGRIQDALDAALRGASPADGFELRLQRRNGERFDVVASIAPVRGEDGRPAGWLASVADISQRRRAGRMHAAEHEVIAILGNPKSLDDAAPDILRALCEHLGWDRGTLWRTDHLVLSPVAEFRANPQPDAEPGTREGLPGRVWASGEPVWISGAPGQFQTALAFPIATASGVFGVIELLSRELQPRDEDLLGTAAALGRLIGRFIGREQAEAALRQSEERYRAIIEMANEGVWVVDTRAKTLYANRRLAEMLGATLDEMTEHTVLDFCFPEDSQAAKQRIGANLQGIPEQFDFRFRRKDGSELLTLACTSPMRDAQGRIIGALGMFSDVTDRKRAEEAVLRLAAIVESSDDAIIGKTLEGTIRTWNSAAERIYGYSAAEAVGRSMTMLLPPDRPDEETAILQRLHRGERVEHFETVRMRKDGRLIDVSTTISPIRDEAGRIIGASSVTRDVTERRRFEEQIRETQKLESLGVLAGGVAHDFNNLLVGIMGNASLALDTVPPENPAYVMVEGVLQASERAANLTRQLLAYSGRGKFVVQPIDISSLVREIFELIRTSISKTVRIRFDLDDALPLIEADVAQIQQLIMNLVINAAEAIGEAAGTVTIRTRLQRVEADGPYACLEVEDTGCGMDEDTRERIFDPFFTTKFTGRGLGLAAALGIVRGHRGTIQVETAPGQGTRFTVTLPAAGGMKVLAEPRQLRDFHGHGTILVVDDEEIVRNTAKSTLERYGYEVLVAVDGREALEYIRSAARIGLVLLDLTMPDMNGEETLLEMRCIRPDLRVILSSGYNEVEAIRRFQGQGLSGFLQKPYTAERLAQKVKAVGAM